MVQNAKKLEASGFSKRTLMVYWLNKKSKFSKIMDKYIVTYSNADGIEKTETFTSEKPEEIIQALTEEGYTLRSMPRKISSE